MDIKVFGYKLQLEVVIACILLGCLICGLTICSCTKGSLKEGLTIRGNNELMTLFPDLKSSPDCCPSTYSNSTGCLCLDDVHKDFIRSRGGNA